MRLAHRIAIAIKTGVVLAAVLGTEAAEFYVAPSGSDANPGTVAQPFLTVARAQTTVRAVNAGMTGDIIVYLRGGRYQLSQTLAFTPADSGTNGFRVIYRSYPGETATISGGKQVTGWTRVAGKPYWVAPVPTAAGFANYFRQLYVNGIRAERAHSDWITGVGYYNDPATANRSCDGITFNAADIKPYSNITDLRLLQITYFKIDEFPVTGITTNSTNGLVQVALQQPYCQMRYNYGTNFFAATGQWMFVQAFEDLDEPGEWYLNRTTQQVYYYPYSYEDMTTAVVYAPVVETLVSVTGNSTTDKVHDIRFQGITFEHGNWFFPRDYMIGGTQTEILFRGVPPSTTSVGYSYEMPGQILLNNTARIEFIGNTLRHLGSCGIHPFNGARDTLIQGNFFYDLTGAAVLGGRWQQDPAIPNQQICTNTVVADNVIRNIGIDFMAATAVNNLQHYGWQVIRNDMADTAYMGVHQRNYVSALPAGGLGGTVISSNRIAMADTAGRYGSADCGAIYSFGVWPNSIAEANDVSDVNQPSAISANVSGLYQDNDSYGWTWRNNVVRNISPGMIGCKWVRYDTTDPNVNVAIGNFTDATVNWTMGLANNINFTIFPLGSPPAAAQAIINAAGVGPAYANLLAQIYSGTNLAQGKHAWASSQVDSSMSPTAAVDWDYTTMWHRKAGDTNAWWAVDLGAPYVIQRIEIAARIDLDQPEARQNFQVQAAANSNFTGYVVLAEQGAVPFPYKKTGLSNSWIKFLNTPQAYRYLRVKKTDTGLLNFSEFRVHGSTPSPATNVTLTATDAYGSTSFYSAGNWDNALPPFAGHDYFTGPYWLRTPDTGGDLEFAGHSLTIDSGAMTFKGLTGDTITIPNLHLNGGQIISGISGVSWTLASNAITLDQTSTIGVAQTAGTLTISGSISGGPSAALNIGVTGGTVVFTGANTYSGPTTINAGAFQISGTLASPVTVLSGATISGTGTIDNSLTVNPGAVVASRLPGAPLAVNGNLTLSGTLNVSNAGGFGLGVYTLFTYTGTLADNGLVIGSTPSPDLVYQLDTSVAGQVRLVVNAAAPVAGFGAAPTSGYAPLSVVFTDASAGIVTGRSWSFGDGGTSTATSPSHVYVSPGNYSVTLTVFGPGGTNALTRSGYITAVADTEPPQVTLTAPATGSVYTNAGVVTVRATATDNVGVARVEFYDGASLAGTDASAPYSFSWPVGEAVNGAHSWTARAYDLVGNVGTSAVVTVTVNVPVDTTPPLLTITQPSDGQTTTAAVVTVTGSVSDAGGISTVTLNGAPAALVGGNWSASVNLTLGTNTVTALASDLRSNTTTQMVRIVRLPPSQVPTVAPAVTNALLAVNSLYVLDPDLPAAFQANATSGSGNPLKYDWRFGDGTSSAEADPWHSYPTNSCAPYSVGLTVYDGLLSAGNGLSVTRPCALVVSNVQVKVSFAGSNRDSAKLRAYPSLPAGLTVANQVVVVAIGGAVQTFRLDDKGRGRIGTGQCQLKYSKSKAVWTATVKWSKGSWAEAWSDDGLTNATVAKPGVEIRLPVILVISNEAFMAEPALHYTATQNKAGSAK